MNDTAEQEYHWQTGDKSGHDSKLPTKIRSTQWQHQPADLAEAQSNHTQSRLGADARPRAFGRRWAECQKRRFQGFAMTKQVSESDTLSILISYNMIFGTVYYKTTIPSYTL